jgi:hypothetical protein
MELKDFVAEALVQIQEGVQEAIERRGQNSGAAGAISPHFLDLKGYEPPRVMIVFLALGRLSAEGARQRQRAPVNLVCKIFRSTKAKHPKARPAFQSGRRALQLRA